MADAGSIQDRLADRDDRLVSAVLGALVTLVLSVLPFSPVAGGAVAASRYYNGGYGTGAGVGLFAGVLAAIPLALLLAPALWIVGRLGIGISPNSPAYTVFLAIVTVLFLSYTVGLSTLGGVVGVWIRESTDLDLDPARWL